MINRFTISVALAALLVSGCSEKKEEKAEAALAVEKAGHGMEQEGMHGIYGVSGDAMQAQSAPQHAPAPAPAGARVGMVVEALDAAGYTYAKVDENGNQFWIAGPQTQIKQGDKVSYVEQMWMENFPSKALNKTFDKIMFVNTIVPAGGAASAGHNCDSCDTPKENAGDAQAAAIEAHKVDAKAHMTSTPLPVGDVKVEKLAGGVTVAEVFGKKEELNGKTVKLRGQVTKVSRGIMGRDWVHIQDGTGANGTNDLTVTAAQATVNVGDIVTAEGVVKAAVDFGYGYSYAVLMEDAKFSK